MHQTVLVVLGKICRSLALALTRLTTMLVRFNCTILSTFPCSALWKMTRNSPCSKAACAWCGCVFVECSLFDPVPRRDHQRSPSRHKGVYTTASMGPQALLHHDIYSEGSQQKRRACGLATVGEGTFTCGFLFSRPLSIAMSLDWISTSQNSIGC
jgi:hypothetical protein